MNKHLTQIAEDFSGHKFESIYEHLHADVEWNMVGGDVYKGRAEVVDACDESANYLSTVKTTFHKFKSYLGGDSVVVDSLGEYVDEQNETSIVASCDIYEFQDGKVREIISYAIELPQS